MKSDETAYQELFEELEKYENKGVYISMDGIPGQSDADCSGTYDKGRRKLYAGLHSGYRRIY